MDPSKSGNISGGGGGSGEQIRRLHIIYFLSRLGRIEQPHLIRIHHLHRNGVYLRDVKRWVADLRGKDMPEAFSWSYKRKYKNGYVWQDLMDDDLITPICDNEYVLKGSEISPSSPIGSPVGTKVSGLKADGKVQVDAEENKRQEHQTNELKQLEEASPREGQSSHVISSPRKTSFQIRRESPVSSSNGSTLTEDYTKQEGEEEAKEEKEANLDKDKPRQEGDKLENSSPSFYTIFLGDKKKKKIYDDDNNIEKVDMPRSSFCSSFSSSQSPFSKSKSYSGGASSIFRNLMNCGAIDTNDTVLVATNKSGSIKPKHGNFDNFGNKAEIRLKNSLEGSSKGSWNQQQHQQGARKSFDGFKASKKEQRTSGAANPSRTVPAAYKPISAPNCSQCGKSFKPEKLHSHMKSCKGMKAFTKGGPASQKKSHDILYENQLVAIS